MKIFEIAVLKSINAEENANLTTLNLSLVFHIFYYVQLKIGNKRKS